MSNKLKIVQKARKSTIDKMGNGEGVEYNGEIYYYQHIGKTIPKQGLPILKSNSGKYIIVFPYENDIFLLKESKNPSLDLDVLKKYSIQFIYNTFILSKTIKRLNLPKVGPIKQDEPIKVTKTKQKANNSVKKPVIRCKCGDIVLIFSETQKKDMCYVCSPKN